MSTPLRERPDAPLGTLIFRAGLLPAETIENALEEGVKTGKRLGEILTERGLIKEVDLARLLAGQKGLSFVTMREQIVDPVAAGLFTEDQARLFRALPYSFEDGTPLVAIADPTDEVLTRNVREALGREDARFVVSARSELIELIGEVYARGVEAPAEEPGPAAPVEPEPDAAETEPELRFQVPAPAAEPEWTPVAPPQPEPEPVAEAPLPQPIAETAPETEPVADQPQPEQVTEQPQPEPVADQPQPEPVIEPSVPQPVAETEPEPAAEPEPVTEAAPEPAAQTLPTHPDLSGGLTPGHVPAGPASEPELNGTSHQNGHGSYEHVTAPAPELPAAPEPQPEPVATPAPVSAAPLVPASEVEPVAVEPLAQTDASGGLTPGHVPPGPVSEPVAAPAPAPAAETTFRVSIRLTNGERVEVGAFDDLEAAKAQAKGLMAQVAAADTGDWPFVSGRFLKPDTIVSVDIG
ncbi:MAG: hypothetical protein ACRDM9_04275 [Gaiellaceae bacterium]